MKHHILIAVLLVACFSRQTGAAEPDTLCILDVTQGPDGVPPAEWEHILPRHHRVYSNYSVVRSIDGHYLRLRSNSTASFLELSLDTIDVTQYSIMVWEWKVDRYPDVEFEGTPSYDDFALRIELVYDFKGSWKNPLNIIRKGLITSLFKRYPPELVVSYVWAVNVPVEKPYVSPKSDSMMIIPIESTQYIKDRWLKEQRNIGEDLEQLYNIHHLYLKKIRIYSDTEDSSTIADSGLKYIYLITED